FLIPNRTLKRRPMTGNAFLQAQRRKYQNKSILMTAVTIGAFLLSWSPYALVSLTATVKGHHVMTSGESEIPELMAKASVIYNPIIYTFINDKFRHTLWGILSGNRGIVLPRGRSEEEQEQEEEEESDGWFYASQGVDAHIKEMLNLTHAQRNAQNGLCVS
ncbi:unnamed protein product, partial [Porites evermanni]